MIMSLLGVFNDEYLVANHRNTRFLNQLYKIHSKALFLTSLLPVLHHKPLLFSHPPFIHILLLKDQKLNMEEYITGFPEVGVLEVFLM